MFRQSPIQRFLSHVLPQGECLIWQASKSGRTGYGKFGVDGRTVASHRWFYERLMGPVPEGLELDHLCRNRACVRPDHLEPVTHKENIRRSPVHVGQRTHCPQGHEYTPENTLMSHGSRVCRICRGRVQAENYRRRKLIV